MAGFSEINKREGSNKTCSWEIFLKKNKKNSMVIRDFRVATLIIHTTNLKVHTLSADVIILETPASCHLFVRLWNFKDGES